MLDPTAIMANTTKLSALGSWHSTKAVDREEESSEREGDNFWYQRENLLNFGKKRYCQHGARLMTRLVVFYSPLDFMKIYVLENV